MGGFGSGRRLESKAVTSSCLSIDVADLKKAGALESGCQFTLQFGHQYGEMYGETEDAQVWFIYAILRGDDYHDCVDCVPLSFTPMRFGGDRPWFMCPYEHCDKRVKKLYIAGRLGCRHCLSLTHQSKNESRSDRLLRKADKIRTKLGWKLGILNPIEAKPKGMSERCYVRFLLEYNRLQCEALQAVVDETPFLQVAMHHDGGG